MLGKIGIPELTLVLVIIVFLFPKKIGGIFSGMGQGLAEFRKAFRKTKEFKDEVEGEIGAAKKEAGI